MNLGIGLCFITRRHFIEIVPKISLLFCFITYYCAYYDKEEQFNRAAGLMVSTKSKFVLTKLIPWRSMWEVHLPRETAEALVTVLSRSYLLLDICQNGFLQLNCQNRNTRHKIIASLRRCGGLR